MGVPLVVANPHIDLRGRSWNVVGAQLKQVVELVGVCTRVRICIFTEVNGVVQLKFAVSVVWDETSKLDETVLVVWKDRVWSWYWDISSQLSCSGCDIRG